MLCPDHGLDCLRATPCRCGYRGHLLGDFSAFGVKRKMSRAFCILAIILTVSVHAAPAHSLSPDSTEDIRCFVAAINLLQTTQDSAARNAAFSSALYYLGRLDGRIPTLDLERLIVAESQKMTQSDLRSELQRCGKELSARGAVVTAIGQKLTRSNSRSPLK